MELLLLLAHLTQLLQSLFLKHRLLVQLQMEEQEQLQQLPTLLTLLVVQQSLHLQQLHLLVGLLEQVQVLLQFLDLQQVLLTPLL
jgi:hypothetical protein